MPFGTNDKVISTPIPKAKVFGANDRVVSTPVQSPDAAPRTIMGDLTNTAMDTGKTLLGVNGDVPFSPVNVAKAGLSAVNGLTDTLGGAIGTGIHALTGGKSVTGQGNAPIEVKDVNGVKSYRYNHTGDFIPVPKNSDGTVNLGALQPRPMISQRQTQDTLGNALANLATVAVPGGAEKAIGAIRPAARVVQAAKTAIPTVDELRLAKNAAYDHADSVGAVYHPDSVSNMVDSLTSDLSARRLNPKLAPTSAALLEEVQSLKGKPASFHDVEDLRQLIGESVGPTASPREKMYASLIKNKLSDFMDSAGPADMVAGDAAAQSTAINKARALNVTYRKAEAINEALGRADLQAASSGTGGNIDNATRQKLKALLQNKRMYWTADETEALNKAVRGGPVQNLLRLVGRMSPEGNGLMLAANTTGALASHGASLPVTAVGIGAKMGAEAMTRGNVENLLRVVTDTKSPITQVRQAQVALKSVPQGILAKTLKRGALANAAANVNTVQMPALPPYAARAAAGEQDRKDMRKKPALPRSK